MKLFLKREKTGVDAICDYNENTKTFTVLKGSKVSSGIAYSEKFKGSKTIEKHRKEYVDKGIVKKDAIFKSSSTAANFVTGTSTNGLRAWKDKDNKYLKEIIFKGDK